MQTRTSARPPKKKSERVPHEKRPQHYGMSHVIWRLKEGMPEMRKPKVLRVLEGAFRAGKRKGEFRLIAYSIQDTHLHMIVEGRKIEEVSRGMQGLGVRITKALNKLWERSGQGSVFRERFKLVALRDYKQITAALNYVLNNALKHRSKWPDGRPDRYSSAPWYRRTYQKFRRPLRSSPVEESQFLVVSCGDLPLISVDQVPGLGALDTPELEERRRKVAAAIHRREMERRLALDRRPAEIRWRA